MLPNSFLQDTFDLLLATGNDLDDAELILYVNEPDPTNPNLDVADLTQPTFAGYASTVLLTPVVAVDAFGVKYFTADPVIIVPTTESEMPVSIVGAAIVSTGGAALIHAVNFASPLTLHHAGQQLHVTARLKLTASGLNFEAYVE